VADTEAGLLPGERLLWTGRPVRSRVILPPVGAQPCSAQHTGFVPAPGERILWVGCPHSWAELMWPAASTDPPQLIERSDPQAVADLICSAQLAERARTWRRTSTHIGGSEPV